VVVRGLGRLRQLHQGRQSSGRAGCLGRPRAAAVRQRCARPRSADRSRLALRTGTGEPGQRPACTQLQRACLALASSCASSGERACAVGRSRRQVLFRAFPATLGSSRGRGRTPRRGRRMRTDAARAGPRAERRRGRVRRDHARSRREAAAFLPLSYALGALGQTALARPLHLAFIRRSSSIHPAFMSCVRGCRSTHSHEAVSLHASYSRDERVTVGPRQRVDLGE
jgi:hypothetical protein